MHEAAESLSVVVVVVVVMIGLVVVVVVVVVVVCHFLRDTEKHCFPECFPVFLCVRLFSYVLYYLRASQRSIISQMSVFCVSVCAYNLSVCAKLTNADQKLI